MTADPEYLFVYGTLMKGFNNPFAEKLHSLSIFEGNGSFSGLLYQTGWYPGAIFVSQRQSRVYGEIYKIQNAPGLIRELDEYEDVFEDENLSLYVRRIIPVDMEDQSTLNCWVYLYNRTVDDLIQIESGNFRVL